MDRLRNEPVALFALVEAIIGVVTATGVVSVEVGGSIASLAAVVLGVGVRGAVTPVRKNPG